MLKDYDLIEAIDLYQVESFSETPRQYIGPSSIANECDAYLAFCLRGFPNVVPDAQLLRIFREGHRLEDQVLADLKGAKYGDDLKGCQDDGKQFEYRHRGHVKGHVDGVLFLLGQADGLCEIKSMNLARFDECSKFGVRLSHIGYYIQMQAYMGMSGLTRCLFVAYCKNNSKYHAEWIAFDPFEWKYIESRLDKIFKGQIHKAAGSESDFRCRGCFKREVCWGDMPVPVKCTTCQKAKPQEDGTWWCLKHKQTCDDPCDDYELYKPSEKE